MHPHIEPLAWDTKFLGMAVGRLHGSAIGAATLRAAIHEARGAGWALLYWSVAATDAVSQAAAQDSQLPIADHRVTYTLAVPPAGADSLPAQVAPTTVLSAPLLALAFQSGHFSRFRTDHRFAPEVFERLYTHWIRQSVRGELAREVLVFRASPTAPEVGLLTLRPEADAVTIGLLAVDERARKQGIGGALLQVAQQRVRAWGFQRLTAVTQRNNLAACQFYENAGFQPSQEEYLYHLWL
ncbi:GNAT family N-acetyltransferase [Hymenobacter sp. BT18]|uniref:GNAT family N-acetyltransferase n=1 Tax=Hymenobacter sp. BT18 TaxID=2835648 RepID=UPI00143E1CA5|nr:GNAT family N-acetyltransferase [Hymenobacter sp. BT18]QIX60925.1 GNAT family N-acetyltransferase [Hymenobacter sp. BT18]